QPQLKSLLSKPTFLPQASPTFNLNQTISSSLLTVLPFRSKTLLTPRLATFHKTAAPSTPISPTHKFHPHSAASSPLYSACQTPAICRRRFMFSHPPARPSPPSTSTLREISGPLMTSVRRRQATQPLSLFSPKAISRKSSKTFASPRASTN